MRPSLQEKITSTLRNLVETNEMFESFTKSQPIMSSPLLRDRVILCCSKIVTLSDIWHFSFTLGIRNKLCCSNLRFQCSQSPIQVLGLYVYKPWVLCFFLYCEVDFSIQNLTSIKSHIHSIEDALLFPISSPNIHLCQNYFLCQTQWYRSHGLRYYSQNFNMSNGNDVEELKKALDNAVWKNSKI